MSFIHIKDDAHASRLADDLAGTPRFALDCEAAGFHRYSDRLCLIQVTTPRATYVVDPFTVDCAALFGGPLADPSVELVMHGADYDIRLLERDLGIRLANLFDTQIAAALVGEKALGLAALLEARLGVKLAKKYQRADWAQRPLSEDMLDYAANDTRYLLELGDIMKRELAEAGRTAWAEEEADALIQNAIDGVRDEAEAEPEDPVLRVKGARDLSPRQVHALREALKWRDEIAQAKDRAPFRVAGDQPLITAALNPPASVQELADIKGFPRGAAKQDGAELLDRLQRVYALDDREVVGYPKPKRTGGRGRPPPEVEEMTERLKRVRGAKANALGIDRGTLMSNAVLQEIAWEDPGDEAALLRVPGIRKWQVEVLGAEILETLLVHG